MTLQQVDALSTIWAMKLVSFSPASKGKASIHIYCTDHHIGQACLALETIYSTASTSSPMMMQDRFTPGGGMDTQFLNRAKQEHMAKKTVSKQEISIKYTGNA